ncbi:MAG: MBL fold metallo-hydrolase [Anaerolineales bacterium]|nr:MBL fold metallo-hydrolase [Anaerolineales bacterium]MCX7608050.1 MBL fold metallo-hydrolase [Anaerolineales bacterium]MDW8227674.1 MBL fold metallo-hydrolase [Anaerolineales bacterium]
MKITFYGAAQTVTGSQYLLEANGARLLLECGLFQGRRAESYERNRTFHYDPRTLQAVLLSHAHIDHSGNLPNLYKQGCRAPIFATPATVHLTDIMLRDSGHIQQADIEYLNKRRLKHGEPPLEPLYTQEDAAQVSEFLTPIPYNQPFEVLPGVTVEFLEAGHILGSAALRIQVREGHRTIRLWFSGDIGRPDLPIVRDPVFPYEVDYLIMECTYGDKRHADPEDARREFIETVRRTVERGGKVIIPAFAVGRTQDLVYTLNRAVSEGILPIIPVFVDSPLAVQASQIFLAHPECYDEETLTFIRENRHPALHFSGLRYISSVEESKALNELKEPAVIISASGMAETGRILHHLKNNIEDPRNTILIVSWQAPNTLGRRLAERETEVRIFGETYVRRAEVVTIGGMSAHAGQDVLVQYARACHRSLKNIFLVHGEPHAAMALQGLLQEAKVIFPTFLSEFDI